MTINAIKKGKNYERDIAHKLTELTKYRWNRTPCSGGFATSHKTNNPVFNGDVFCEDARYNTLVIECKATKKPVLITDIFNHKSLLHQYIDQCKRECDGHDWILFVKMNGRTTFFICEQETFRPRKEELSIIDSYCIIDKYSDIFQGSVPILFGSWYLGLLQ